MSILKSFRSTDRTLLRNYGAFLAILVISTSVLFFVLLKGDRTLSKINDQVVHTYNVINAAQDLSGLVEGMVASQHGYLVTMDDKFMERYHKKRNKVSELVARLAELTKNDQSQESRLDELRHHFNELSVQLEQRAQTYTLTSKSKVILDDVEQIDGLKENILSTNNAILREEYAFLNKRISQIEIQKSYYFWMVLLGISMTMAMLLIFNIYIAGVQKRKALIEASLKDTEERFSLAIEGTQDGIFDWNLLTEEIFYSNRFFEMLGYLRGAFTGTVNDIKNLIHPEDSARVWEYIERYLQGELEDYSQEFRMKHQDGRWIWVQSRAKAIFDPAGNALRLVGAHTDISDLKEYQSRLEQEKKTAEEANRAKSDFLAHMSHEIRTPLTAISGIAEIFVKRHENFDERETKLIKTLHSSVNALKDLINDILDFSKIETGEVELEQTDFKLQNLFEEIISMMAMRASEKGISFVFDYSEVKNRIFTGDKLRMRQIIVNLIGNAIKFTQAGAVTVKAKIQERDGNENLVLEVVDTGIGISPENFDLIFERFKQGDASVSRKYGGTGLGLPISRNLAEIMGGNIFVTSTIGKGSTFTFYVPIPSGNKIFEKKQDAPKISQKYASPKNDDYNSKRILMVEDYEGNVLVVGNILEELGYKYDVAHTGKEAIEMWSKTNYDLILMDIQMPEMDGFAATRTIRAQEEDDKLNRVPIIGMTAHALVEDKEKCIAAGMDAYLPKPIVEEDFRRQILKFLENRLKAA